MLQQGGFSADGVFAHHRGRVRPGMIAHYLAGFVERSSCQLAEALESA